MGFDRNVFRENYAFVRYLDSLGLRNRALALALVVDKVRRDISDEKKIVRSEESAKTAIWNAAMALEIILPIKEIGDYTKLFAMAPSIIDWSVVLEYCCNDRCVMPMAMKSLFEDTFTEDVTEVFISEGEDFIKFLPDIVERYEFCNFTINCYNPEALLLVKSLLGGYNNVEVISCNVLEYESLARKFDLIWCVPAIGQMRPADRKTVAPMFLCKEMEFVAFQNMLLHLKRNGRLTIVLPGRIQFAGDKVASLRNYVMNSYMLREISELPSGSFRYTNLKSYFLTVDNQKSDDSVEINVNRYTLPEKSKYEFEEDSFELKEENKTFILQDELRDQGDWSVEKVFARQDESWMEYQESAIKKVPLKDVAAIIRGKSIFNEEEKGDCRIINISNIGDYYVNVDEDTKRVIGDDVQKYLLQPGDLLMPARGTKELKVGVFEIKDISCIASSNVIRIRTNSELLNPYYLKMFLDSDLGKKMIKSAQQGGMVMNISYKDFQHLEVPLPPIEKQNELVKVYKEELERYISTTREAEERWKKIRSELSKFS